MTGFAERRVLINTAVADADRRSGVAVPVTPRWTSVARLPGYLQQGIRTIGRAVFRRFPDFQAVPLENIQVLAHYTGPGGQAVGPNNRAEIEALANWIVRNGVRDDTARLDFGQTFGRGYAPDVQVWNVPGASFMLVRERARQGHVQIDGMCIYAVPGGRGTQLRHDAQRDRERLSDDGSDVPASVLAGARGGRVLHDAEDDPEPTSAPSPY